MRPSADNPESAEKPATQVSELRRLLGQESPNRLRQDADARSKTGLRGQARPRRLIDCLAGTAGSGAGLVALWLCQEACRERGELVVIDTSGGFYPPAAISWGVDAKRLLVVTPAGDKEALAATEIALRSPAVGAVWARLGRVDDRAFRRLLLAAESASAFGALVRPGRYQSQPSWADAQFLFEPIGVAGDPNSPFAVRVTQTRNRHGPAGGESLVAIDWRTGRIEPLCERSCVALPLNNAG